MGPLVYTLTPAARDTHTRARARALTHTHETHTLTGPETRRWEDGKCMIYDTTFEHETLNESPDEERVSNL